MSLADVIACSITHDDRPALPRWTGPSFDPCYVGLVVEEPVRPVRARADKPAPQRARVLEALRQAGPIGLTSAALAQALGSDVHRMSSALCTLGRQGRARRIGTRGRVTVWGAT